MVLHKETDGYRQLTNDSLPEILQNKYDDALIAQAIARVVKCYQPSAACLVLEAVDELRITAAYGMSSGTLPLSSIARHVSGWPLPIIIYDARADERFVNDSLVVGPPFARFYAGAPIIIGDEDTSVVVGCLCLFETAPRKEYLLDDCEALVQAARTIADHFEELDIEARNVTTMTTLQQLPPLNDVEQPEREPSVGDCDSQS